LIRYFSKDDAKGQKRPLPGHCGASFAPFLPKNPSCAKIPRMMREKNTRFLLEIFHYTLIQHKGLFPIPMSNRPKTPG
jgi:hypothetical protein